MQRGDPVHGEVDSADASGGVTVLLYPAGSSTARTLASNERLTITDVNFVSTAGGLYSLYWGADTPGLKVVSGNAEVLGGLVHEYGTPLTGPKGVAPILAAASGQVDLTISGFITEV